MGRGSRGGLLPSVRGRPSLVSNGIGRGIMPGLYMVIVIIALGIMSGLSMVVIIIIGIMPGLSSFLRSLRRWDDARLVQQLHYSGNLIHSVSNNNLAISRNVSSPRNDLSFWSRYLVFAGACLTDQVTTKDGGCYDESIEQKYPLLQGKSCEFSIETTSTRLRSQSSWDASDEETQDAIWVSSWGGVAEQSLILDFKTFWTSNGRPKFHSWYR